MKFQRKYNLKINKKKRNKNVIQKIQYHHEIEGAFLFFRILICDAQNPINHFDCMEYLDN